MAKDERLYSNIEVSRIAEVTPRQVIYWTERGLISPTRETTGAGIKRGYDYINLIEICLCKRLLNMGLNVHTVKKIIEILTKIQGRDQEILWYQKFVVYEDKFVQIMIDFANIKATIDSRLKQGDE